MKKTATIFDEKLERALAKHFNKSGKSELLLKSKSNESIAIKIVRLASRTPLQNLLEERGMTLSEVHDITGVAYPTLINVNRGYMLKAGKRKKYRPRPRTMRDIAALFKVPYEELMEGYKNLF